MIKRILLSLVGCLLAVSLAHGGDLLTLDLSGIEAAAKAAVVSKESPPQTNNLVFRELRFVLNPQAEKSEYRDFMVVTFARRGKTDKGIRDVATVIVLMDRTGKPIRVDETEARHSKGMTMSVPLTAEEDAALTKEGILPEKK